METLGKKIAKLRKQRGLTQDQLAEAMAVSPQAVSKWETEISCPDIYVLPQLADYFDVSLDELMGRIPEHRDAHLVPQGERKDYSKMLLKVVVDSAGGDRVRVNLPVPLIKMGIEIGKMLPQVADNQALQTIDFDVIIEAVDNGVVGELVSVDSADGDKVSIVIE